MHFFSTNFIALPTVKIGN